MIKKNTHHLAVAAAAPHAAPTKGGTGTFPSLSSLVTRMLRALRLRRPATRDLHTVEILAEATGSLPQYEHHCASESEAREFAAAMARQGTRAEVAYDPYDFSWSVEVYGPDDHPPRHDT